MQMWTPKNMDLLKDSDIDREMTDNMELCCWTQGHNLESIIAEFM